MHKKHNIQFENIRYQQLHVTWTHENNKQHTAKHKNNNLPKRRMHCYHDSKNYLQTATELLQLKHNLAKSKQT